MRGEKFRALALVRFPAYRPAGKFQIESVKKFPSLFGACRPGNFSEQSENLDSTSRRRRFLFATFFAAKENGEQYFFLKGKISAAN
jgi:hypothetical protein